LRGFFHTTTSSSINLSVCSWSFNPQIAGVAGIVAALTARYQEQATQKGGKRLSAIPLIIDPDDDEKNLVPPKIDKKLRKQVLKHPTADASLEKTQFFSLRSFLPPPPGFKACRIERVNPRRFSRLFSVRVQWHLSLRMSSFVAATVNG
jgi:hypothetical protein